MALPVVLSDVETLGFSDVLNSRRLMFLHLLLMMITYSLETESSRLEARTFTLHTERKNWTAARDTCTTTYGRLGVIRDISTLPDLTYSLPEPDSYGAVWIGLIRQHNIWEWVTGQKVTWTNWGNGTNMADNCSAAVSLTYPADWTIFDCDLELPFLCEHQGGDCFYAQQDRASIIGFNDFHVSRVNATDCARICDEAVEIQCSSFEYGAQFSYCQLSGDNRWSQNEHFWSFDTIWEYYHRVCNIGEIYNSTSELHTTTPSSAVTSTKTSFTTSNVAEMHTLFPRKYVLYEELVTWSEAEIICRQSGGKLARIYNLSTIPELDLHLYNLNETKIWIGLSITNFGTEWSWSDDVSPADWLHWKYDPGYKTCAMVELLGDFKWVAESCSRQHYFMCELPGETCQWTEWKNGFIVAHNRDILMNVSLVDCRYACDDTSSDWCRSFDFNYVTGTCNLCDTNRWQVSPFYKEGNEEWNYHHLRCNFGFLRNRLLDTTTEATVTSSVVYTTETVTTSLSTESPTTTTTEAPSTTATWTTTTVRETTLTICTVRPTTEPSNPTIAPEIIEELQAFEVEAKKKKKKRAKTSATDDRPSSKSVGSIAIAILSSIMVFIIILDMHTCYTHCSYMKNNIKYNKWRKKQLTVKRAKVNNPSNMTPEPEVCIKQTTHVTEMDFISRAKTMADMQAISNDAAAPDADLGMSGVNVTEVELHITSGMATDQNK